MVVKNLKDTLQLSRSDMKRLIRSWEALAGDKQVVVLTIDFQNREVSTDTQIYKWE